MLFHDVRNLITDDGSRTQAGAIRIWKSVGDDGYLFIVAQSDVSRDISHWPWSGDACLALVDNICVCWSVLLSVS